MPSLRSRVLRPFVGAVAGLVVARVLGAISPYSFHTIRSWVTGQTEKYAIISHPANESVSLAIHSALAILGATAAILVDRRRRHGRCIHD